MLRKSTIKSAREEPVRDGHRKEAAEVAKANREPKATPFPPAEAWSLLYSCFVLFVCNTLLRLRLVSFMKSVA